MRALVLWTAVLTAALPAAHGEEVLVPVGASWKYFKGTTEASSPVTAWRQIGFADGSWLEGPTGIGYGDGDDATVLGDMLNGYPSIFMRKTFSVADPGAVSALEFSMDYDDGFVAYLNGTEIARRGLSGNPVPFNALATSREAGVAEIFAIMPSLLVAGTNVLAIQAHNTALSSGDLSAIPRLLANPTVALTRGPYLQLGGPTTMTLVWKTGAPANGAVEYGTTPALGSSAASPGVNVATHVVTLNDLMPATTYHYRVLGNGVVLVQGLTFKTFPAAEAGDAFRLVAWGDSGVADANQASVAARILALTPDLAIHTGDLIYPAGEAANFDPRYFQPYASLLTRVAVYNCLGNHDVGTSNGQPYLDNLYLPANNPGMTERYYSFDHGNVHFIALDTNQAINAGSTQRAWLESDLATMAGLWTIVFHHHTPYDVSTVHADNAVNTTIRAHLSPLYDQYRVDLVMVGHAHAYERTYPVRYNNVVSAAGDPNYVDPLGPIYITTGGGGNALYPRNFAHANNAFLVTYQQQFHATTLDFAGNTLTGRAVKHDGAILDTFSITRSLDGEAPVLTGVAAVEVTDTGARIIWNTNELADSVVEYGLTPALGSSSSDSRRTTIHSRDLSGLFAGLEYHYRVLSRDRSGNQAVGATGTFFTTGTPFDPDTVAYWRLEANLLDSIPAARHGTASGTVSFTTQVPGATIPQTAVPNARALQLSGLAHVSFPDPALDLVDGESATIESFFRASSTLSDRILLHQGEPTSNGAGPENEMYLQVTAAGALVFYQYQGGIANVALASEAGAVTAGAWHHVAVTLASSKATLHLDGVSVASDFTIAPWDKSGWVGEFRVGKPMAAGAGALAWFGEVDEVRISSRPLFPGQFLQTQPMFRLDLSQPGVLVRSDAFEVMLLGTSTLPLFAYSAKIKYDPALLQFTGTPASVFDTTVWSDADNRGLTVDPLLGEINLGVVREVVGSGKPPLPPQDYQPFARLAFQAGQCTGAVTFELDETFPDDNILVTEEPEVTGRIPATLATFTVIQVGETFVRGDVNGSDPIDPDDSAAVVTLADVLYLLAFLYQEGPEPPCREAADINVDARINIVDAVFLLQHLTGNPLITTIAAPWPDSGRAPVPYFSCYNAPPSACTP